MKTLRLSAKYRMKSYILRNMNFSEPIEAQFESRTKNEGLATARVIGKILVSIMKKKDGKLAALFEGYISERIRQKRKKITDELPF